MRGNVRVEERPKVSKRENQERAMQEIVFDDLNTPHFRLRSDKIDDKTLEEASKKPMTIMLGEPAEDQQEQIREDYETGN